MGTALNAAAFRADGSHGGPEDDMPNAVSVNDLLIGVRLSTKPAVAARLVDAASADQIDAATIAQIVGLDHALTSIVLRAANADNHGSCGSLPAAIDRLGVSALTSLALGSMLAEGLDTGTTGFNERTFRRWSMHTAVAARAIARASGVWDPDEAYAAALLQDAGVLGMVHSLGDTYVRLLAQTTGDHHSLPALERERWGVDHAQVGAAAAARWGLPTHMAQAIAQHHDASDGASVSARVLDLAGTLAAALLSQVSEEAMTSFRQRADNWFALGAADTETLVRSVSDEAGVLLGLLRITSIEDRDIERLLLRAEEQWVRHQARLGHQTRELERRNRDLTERADCDALTGVGTRGLLERQLPQCVQHCADTGQPLAVAFIDIDGLKPVNDRLGHAVGDDMLRRVAAAIRTAAGEGATVCRFGGDEFVVLLPGHDGAAVSLAADRMRIDASIEGRRGGDIDCGVTLSIGCASLEASRLRPTSGRELLEAADDAMYVAKRSGGDAVELTTVGVSIVREAA